MFFVTNLVEAFTPEVIVRTYQKRGTKENYIKEAGKVVLENEMNNIFVEIISM